MRILIGGLGLGIGREGQGAQVELELELIQSRITHKPMLRGEVGARALRLAQSGGKREGSAGGAYKRARRGVVGRVRLHE